MALLASLPNNLIHKVKPVAASDSKLREKLCCFFTNALLIKRKIDRNDPQNNPINKILNALDNGDSLILFPEGTRGEPEKEQAFKKGIGLILSQRPDIKFIPAFLKGLGKVMPKGDHLIVPFNSSIRYGKPTHITDHNPEKILAQIKDNFIKLK